MSQPPVDIAVLNELRSIMGDEFNLLMDVFVTDSEQRIEMIATAIANNDAEALRGAAHSFKGSSMNLSASRLTELCRDLEFMGREKNLDRAGAVFAEAKQEFAVVRDFLATL